MVDALPDRRSRRTRAALQRAFVQLLLEQGYEAITIGAVVQRADVGRSTFYEHYRTKQDLLRASIVGPFSILADLSGPGGAGTVPGTVTDTHLTALLRHFRDNQQLARVLLGGPTRALLGQLLAELILQRLNKRFAGLQRIPPDVIARQIADAELSLVDSWVHWRSQLALDVAADALRRTATALASLLGDAADGQGPLRSGRGEETSGNATLLKR